MQLTTNRDDLTSAVETACETVARRNTKPILSNIAIRGHGDHMTVTGTDLDMYISVSIPAVVDSRFTVTIPAFMLKDLLKKARKSEHVGLTTVDDNVTLDLGKTKYKLRSLPINEFPETPGPKDASQLTLTGADLYELLGSVQGAISDEETRYYLNGVYLHLEGENIVAVATDGHRLARKQVPMPKGGGSIPGVIIPKKLIYKFLKLTKGKKCPETVLINVSETRIRFQFDNITITSKLIDGTFPDYRRVIPVGNDQIAWFDARELTACINDVSLMSATASRAVKLVLNKADCRLEVVNPGSGSSTASMSIKSDIAGLEIGFNYKYVRDALAWVGEGMTRFELLNSGSPTRITGSREGFDVTLMPMRV